MKKLIAVAVFSLVLTACKASDPSVVGPPTQKAPVVYPLLHQGTPRDAPVTFDPKVDILFVIDDSQSMEKYQQRLKDNVRQFVAAIAKSGAIDFHIGVTQVWDSTRYSTGKVPPSCTEADGTVHINYVGFGALLPLKAPPGKESLLGPFDKRFISKQPGFESVLEQSILIGVQELIKANAKKTVPCESGPEVEEILTPIWASFQADAVSKFQPNFWRPDSLKVFMILSDAKEGSNLTAKFVDSTSRKWTGAPAKGPQDKYRVYVAGMVPGTTVNGSTCRPDFGFKLTDNTIPNHEIAELARLSGGKILSICDSDYGQKLAGFGDEIKMATLKNVRQKLEFRPNRNETQLPESKRFQLKFKGERLKEGGLSIDLKTGKETITGGADWAYDTQTNDVVIRGNFWDENPKASIDIVYVRGN